MAMAAVMSGQGVEMATDRESSPMLTKDESSEASSLAHERKQVESAHTVEASDGAAEEFGRNRGTVRKSILLDWKKKFDCCRILSTMFEIHMMALLLFIFAAGVVYFQFAYPLRSWHELFICKELGDGKLPDEPQMPQYMNLKETYVFLFQADDALASGQELCNDQSAMMMKHRWIFGLYDAIASFCAMSMPICSVGVLWGWDYIRRNKKFIWLWFLWLAIQLVGWTTRDLYVYPFGRLMFYISDGVMGPPMVLIFCVIYSKWIEKDTLRGTIGKQYANTKEVAAARQSVVEAPFLPKFPLLKMLKITTRNGTAMFMQCFAWLGVIGIYLFLLTVLFSFPCMHPMAQIGVLMVHYGASGGALAFCFKSCVLYTNTLNDRTLTLSFVGVLCWTSLAERFMLLDIPLMWLAPFLVVGLVMKIVLKIKQDEPSGKIDPLLGVTPAMVRTQRFKNLVGDKEYMTMVCEMCAVFLAALVRVCIYRFWTDLYKPAQYWSEGQCEEMCEDFGSKAGRASGTRCEWKAGEGGVQGSCDIGAYACLKADKYNEWIGDETDGYCVMKQEVEWECNPDAGIKHCYSGILYNISLQYGIEIVEMFLLCMAYHARIRSIGKYWWQLVMGYIYVLMFFGLHFFYNYYFKLQQEMGMKVTNVFGIGNDFDPSTCPAY